MSAPAPHCQSQSLQSKHWFHINLPRSCQRKLPQLPQQRLKLKSLAFSSVSGKVFSVAAALKPRKLKTKRKPAQEDPAVVAEARTKTAAIVRVTVDLTTAIVTATAMKDATIAIAMPRAQRRKLNQLASKVRAEAVMTSLDLQPSKTHVSKKSIAQALQLKQLTRALKQVKAENSRSVQMTSVEDHVVAASVRMFQPMSQNSFLLI